MSVFEEQDMAMYSPEEFLSKLLCLAAISRVVVIVHIRLH